MKTICCDKALRQRKTSNACSRMHDEVTAHTQGASCRTNIADLRTDRPTAAPGAGASHGWPARNFLGISCPCAAPSCAQWALAVALDDRKSDVYRRAVTSPTSSSSLSAPRWLVYSLQAHRTGASP